MITGIAQVTEAVTEAIYGKKFQSLEAENGWLKSIIKGKNEKIKTLESSVDGLKLELSVEKNSLKLTSWFLYVSLAMNTLLILGITFIQVQHSI
jgi:hypothetical protein